MSDDLKKMISKFNQGEDVASSSDACNPNEINETNDRNEMQNISSVIFNEKLVIDLTTVSIDQIQKDYASCCKVLKFKFDCNEDFVKLSTLKAEKHPYLFIFIISAENFEFLDPKTQEPSEKLKVVEKYLLNFCKIRPMLLQITSKCDNDTNIFYKDENSQKFSIVDQQMSHISSHQDLRTFLKIFMNHNNENFDHEMIGTMFAAQNSSLILRLFRTLELSEDFWEDVALKCAVDGTKDQLLASLDAPFDVKGQISNFSAQKLLKCTFTFCDDSDSSSETEKSPLEEENESSVEKKSNSVTKSIFSVAVENSNKIIIEFLIENFSYVLQELRHDHRTQISTIAFESKQFDVLCNLLQYADFPFPKDFNSLTIEHAILKQVAADRKKFHDAIVENNLEAVKKFIDDNSNLKLVFDAKNETAMSKALTSKSFKILLHLKTFGFEAIEFSSYYEKLSEDERKLLEKLTSDKVQENVNSAGSDDHASVKILASKSRIHNIRKYDKETQLKQRKQINKWFNDIKKTESGKDMVDVAAQCEHLKFTFDFESDTVSNVDLESVNSLGVALPSKRWIFVGAKISNENREQEIKGVLAHELSHYTMRMVFENKEKPYHIKDITTRELFDGITNEINVWTFHDSEGNKIIRDDQIDDECDGIISTVFLSYERDEYHLELIVRVQHILAQFDNNPVKVEYLKEKYKPLFDFHENVVVPEMRKFNSKKRKFNKLFGFLPQIEEFELKFENPKDLTALSSTEIVIAISDVPQLLLHDIYNQACAQQDQKPFIDDKNVFIKSEKFNNQAIANEYLNIQTENKDMRIYVDCSKDFGTGLGSLFVNQSQKFIFVVQTDGQCESLTKALENSGRSNRKAEINYEFKDLTVKSRKKFLPSQVSFQNSRKSLFQLLLSNSTDGNSKEQQETKVANDLVEVVDDKMLNHLMEKTKISINTIFFEDLSKNINFIILLLPRKFIKIFKDNSMKSREEMFEEELVADTRHQKYIIISDIAGTGKSWAMKSIAKFLQQKFGTCWIAYVDLKQFISAFDALKDKPDFLTFMVDYVLKDHQKFELKIFKKLYEKGKTFVLFDGFDEISPKYYETVVSIIKSFEANGGNQMWIATRDHFEVDLQRELDVDVVYKLDEFTKQNGIDMIASIWVMNELKSQNGYEMFKNANDIKQSSSFKSHREIARKLLNRISSLKFSSIGFPQFYKMIAEVFKDNKKVESNLNNFKIYDEFVEIQIKKWSTKEGILRMKKSSQAQRGISSFTEVHQFLAMKSSFPDEDEFCGLELDEDDWSDEEIVGCGLVTKNGENFLFSHETFHEFFAADFILNILKKGGSPKLMEFFIQFLTVQKHEVIRMFLNDALVDEAVVKKIDSKIQKTTKSFDKSLNGSELIFANINENRSNLIMLLIKLLERLENGKVKNILDKNIDFITSKLISVENILKIQKWFTEALEVGELKEFILRHNIFYKSSTNWNDSEVLKNLISRIEQKIGKEFLRELLSSKDSLGQNIFLQICYKNVFNEKIFECLTDEIFAKYFTSKELLEILEQCDNEGRNILYYCVMSKSLNILELVWEKIEICFKSKNLMQQFHQLLMQKCQPNDWNVLHLVTKSGDISFHKKFWKLLLKTFDDREELQYLILAEDKHGDNFVHNLVKWNIAAIIEFTIEMMKENFSKAQFQEILKSKGDKERNLLQAAADSYKNIKLHRFLWKIMKQSCESDEKFMKIIKYVDKNNWNIFHIAKAYSTNNILEFFIDETEKVASREEIKTILSELDFQNRNFLHIAAEFNKSSELHQSLWKILNKYFEPTELISFIKCLSFDDCSMFELAMISNTREVVELTWTKIKELFDKLDLINDEFEKEITQCDLIMKNVKKSSEFDEISKENLKINWRQIVGLLNEKFQEDIFQVKMLQHKEYVRPEYIKSLVHFKDTKLCEDSWNNLLRNYENREHLKTLILDEQFMLQLVSFSTPEILKLTLNKFKKIFSGAQFKEILKFRDNYQRSLIQELTLERKNYTEFCSIWSILKTCLNKVSAGHEHPIESLMPTEIFEEVDKDNYNIFHIAAENSTSEIFEFLIDELEKVEEKQKIKELLSKVNIRDENLLQIAAKANKSIKLHESLWKVIRNYVDQSEILNLVIHSDGYGRNLIFTAIRFNFVNILKLIWTEIENISTVDQMIGLVEHRDKESKNIFHACVELKDVTKLEFVWKKLENLFKPKNSSQKITKLLKQKLLLYDRNVLHLIAKCNGMKFQETFWKLLLGTIEDGNELTELILQKDSDGNNFVHHLVRFSRADIIAFTIEIIRKNFSETQFQEVLKSKGFQKRNLLQTAFFDSKDLLVLRILWKTLKDSCKSDKQFVKIIKEVDEHKSNVFNIAAHISTSEILKFVIEGTEKVALHEDIRQLISALDDQYGNLLHRVAFNKSLDLHESLWKILQNYFDRKEIFDFINHIDIDGETPFMTAAKYSTKEAMEFMWTKIQSFLDENDQIEYLKKKDKNGNGIMKLSLVRYKNPEVHKWVEELLQKYS